MSDHQVGLGCDAASVVRPHTQAVTLCARLRNYEPLALCDVGWEFICQGEPPTNHYLVDESPVRQIDVAEKT